MAELDELRSALRSREPLAPDPDEVLAGADRRFRRVRARRRAAGVAAVVAITMAGLTVGVGLLRQHPGPSPVRIATAPVDAPLPQPSLPFTVGPLPALRLTSWSVSTDVAGGQYDLAGVEFDVSLMAADPETDLGDRPVPMTVNGIPAGMRWFAQTRQVRLSWEAQPGKWVSVTTDSTAQNSLKTVAETVRLAPAVAPSLVRSLRVPPALTVSTWSGSDSFDRIELCPRGVKAPVLAASCVEVLATDGSALASPKTSFAPTDPPSVQVGGVGLELNADGRTVTRDFGQGRSLTVRTELGDPAVLPAIAASVSLN